MILTFSFVVIPFFWMALLYYEKEKKKQVLFYFLFHFVFISFSERIIWPLFFV